MRTTIRRLKLPRFLTARIVPTLLAQQTCSAKPISTKAAQRLTSSFQFDFNESIYWVLLTDCGSQIVWARRLPCDLRAALVSYGSFLKRQNPNVASSGSNSITYERK